MNKNFYTIIFFWGGIFALGMILIHLLIHSVVLSDQLLLKNALEIIGLIFSLFCVYKSVYAYRALHEKNAPFVALKGIKIAIGTLCVFSVLFFAYSLIFYNFVNKTFVENYKQNQIEYIQNSNLSNEKKEQNIEAVTSLNTMSYIISNLFRTLIFPVMGMLFIVAFMQRKPVKSVETKKQ